MPPFPGGKGRGGAGVGALPPAGRHVTREQRDAGRGGTRDTPLPPSCPGDRGIREDVAAGELHPHIHPSPPSPRIQLHRELKGGFILFHFILF